MAILTDPYAETKIKAKLLYNSDYYKKRGLYNMQLCNYHQAIAAFSKCIRLEDDPQKKVAYYRYRAKAKCHVDNYKGALIDEGKASKLEETIISNNIIKEVK